MPAPRKNAVKPKATPKLTPKQKREAKLEAKKAAERDKDWDTPEGLTAKQRAVYDALFAKANFIYQTASTVQIYMNAELIYALHERNHVDAADFIENCAPGLTSWQWTNKLIQTFRWGESPQGYDYWADIYWDLVTNDKESLTEHYNPGGAAHNQASKGKNLSVVGK